MAVGVLELSQAVPLVEDCGQALLAVHPTVEADIARGEAKAVLIGARCQIILGWEEKINQYFVSDVKG